jgi:hypothetical protein
LRRRAEVMLEVILLWRESCCNVQFRSAPVARRISPSGAQPQDHDPSHLLRTGLGYSGIKSLCRIRGEVAPVERLQCPLQFHSASQVSASCPSLPQALVRPNLPCDLGICYMINLLPPLTNTSSLLCGSTISNFSAFTLHHSGGIK